MMNRNRKLILGVAFLVPLLTLMVWFVAAAPNRCKLYQNLGYIFLSKGTLAAPSTQLNSAASWFSTTPEAECKTASTTFGLGEAYSGLGQPSPAIAALQDGQERAGLRAFLIGRIYEAMGRREDAWREYRTLPRDAAAHFYGLGDLAEKNGDFEKAVYYFSVATTINPAYPKAHYAAAFVYWRRLGNTGKAAEMIRQALAVDPKPSVARDFYHGLLCYYQGDTGCALTAWTSAVLQPSTVDTDAYPRYLAYEMLGRILFARGLLPHGFS